MANIYNGMTAASLKTFFLKLSDDTVLRIAKLMAKDFDVKLPSKKDKASLVKFIMDTDDEELGEFCQDLDKKKICAFPGSSKSTTKSPSSKTDTPFDGKVAIRELNALVERFARENGLVFKARTCTYSDSHIKFSCEVHSSAKSQNGILDRDAKTWKAFAAYTPGVDVNWLGKTFMMGGKHFRIVGANPRAYRAPIKLQEVNTNRSYKTSIDSVKFNMR